VVRPGRHRWGWTTPGSTRSRPSKKLAISSRVRRVAVVPRIRSFTRRVISAIAAGWMSLAGWVSTR